LLGANLQIYNARLPPVRDGKDLPILGYLLGAKVQIHPFWLTLGSQVTVLPIPGYLLSARCRFTISGLPSGGQGTCGPTLCYLLGAKVQIYPAILRDLMRKKVHIIPSKALLHTSFTLVNGRHFYKYWKILLCYV